VAQNQSIGRARLEFLQKMIQPCGPYVVISFACIGYSVFSMGAFFSNTLLRLSFQSPAPQGNRCHPRNRR
jgi:hypothetical protein